MSASLADTEARPVSRSRFLSRRRVALTLTAVVLITVAVVAAVWWWTYEPISAEVAFGGGGSGVVVVGVRTENTGRFDVRVIDVANRQPGAGVRLRSVRTRATPAARTVLPFEPFTLKPGHTVYLALEFAIICGQIPRDGSSLGSVDIQYESLWIGRTKHVASVNNDPELAPAQAGCA